MHTSGSTGRPKGVVIPHRGVIDYIDWAKSCINVDHTDSIGNQAPLYFDNSTLDIYLSWAVGLTLNLIPDTVFMFPAKLIDYLEEYEITTLFFVPSVLVNVAQMKVLSPDRLPNLKYVIFAGEVMPTKHLAYWQEVLPEKVYLNLYGPTEITVDCTYFFVDRVYKSDESLPIGYPCKNSDVLILTEKNQHAEIDEQGELCVRGSSLAIGYWNDTQKTDAAFVQNPLQPNYLDRIYRTGDIVYKNSDNQIIYVGRKDSQIKHMGYRIELGEIERAICSLEEINNCCVLYNAGVKEITLFYEANEEIQLGELRKRLFDIIPNYMIPKKSYYFQNLPINPNGKIDRNILKVRYLDKKER
jgi:amino acid adenylation domain-containing protein